MSSEYYLLYEDDDGITCQVVANNLYSMVNTGVRTMITNYPSYI